MNRTIVLNAFDDIDNKDLAALLSYDLPKGSKVNIYTLTNGKTIFASKDETETECEVYDFWVNPRTDYEKELIKDNNK